MRVPPKATTKSQPKALKKPKETDIYKGAEKRMRAAEADREEAAVDAAAAAEGMAGMEQSRKALDEYAKTMDAYWRLPPAQRRQADEKFKRAAMEHKLQELARSRELVDAEARGWRGKTI